MFFQVEALRGIVDLAEREKLVSRIVDGTRPSSAADMADKVLTRREVDANRVPRIGRCHRKTPAHPHVVVEPGAEVFDRGCRDSEVSAIAAHDLIGVVLPHLRTCRVRHRNDDQTRRENNREQNARSHLLGVPKRPDGATPADRYLRVEVRDVATAERRADALFFFAERRDRA